MTPAALALRVLAQHIAWAAQRPMLVRLPPTGVHPEEHLYSSPSRGINSPTVTGNGTIKMRQYDGNIETYPPGTVWSTTAVGCIQLRTLPNWLDNGSSFRLVGPLVGRLSCIPNMKNAGLNAAAPLRGKRQNAP